MQSPVRTDSAISLATLLIGSSLRQMLNSGAIVGCGIHENDPSRQIRAFLLTPQAQLNTFGIDRIRQALEVVVMFIRGVEHGAGGGALLPGGHYIPIPPRQDFEALVAEWQRLSRRDQDILLGSTGQKLASLVTDAAKKRRLEQAGTDMVKNAIEELERAKKAA
jgi:hypothetical protein